MHDKSLARWAVPAHELPDHLYFVSHAQSQSFLWCETDPATVGARHEHPCPVCNRPLPSSDKHSIQAAQYPFGPHRPQNVGELYAKMAQHLDWNNRIPTIFVSAFGDYQNAVDWAKQRDGPVGIIKVNTNNLPAGEFVFRPVDYNPEWPGDEYLFFGRIPQGYLEKHWGVKRGGELKD
ncbi:hypothetical protein B0T20DRAFT_492016 [Sordaria brevicollis]|uniref:Uncharacterized protein n=1 Tax=Sordaria brevicollis TaxID=83679 RepID=A0AAE0PK12_SORBR|nr:hypothetical protein B0T20DRAFT_492016 [Sordaria brevicollis]